MMTEMKGNRGTAGHPTGATRQTKAISRVLKKAVTRTGPGKRKAKVKEKPTSSANQLLVEIQRGGMEEKEQRGLGDGQAERCWAVRARPPARRGMAPELEGF